MLKIRLQRTGRKHEPVFRVVVTDRRAGPKSGNAVEVIGNYDARKKDRAQIDTERVTYWMGQGAQPSDTVRNVLIDSGVLKGKKVNVLPKKSPIVSEAPAEETPSETATEEASTDVEESEAPAEEATVATEEAEEAPAETEETSAAAEESTKEESAESAEADPDEAPAKKEEATPVDDTAETAPTDDGAGEEESAEVASEETPAENLSGQEEAPAEAEEGEAESAEKKG